MARRLSLGSKKKVRGLRRHLRHLYGMPEYAEHLIDWIANNTAGERGHFDLKLPLNQALVEGPSKKKDIVFLCIRLLLESCQRMRSRKPSDKFVRVVAMVSLPEIWSSRIIAFTDEDYFAGFFDGNGPYQVWTRMDPSLIDNQFIDPATWIEIGSINSRQRLPLLLIHEKIIDEDFVYECVDCFFGDVDHVSLT